MTGTKRKVILIAALAATFSTVWLLREAGFLRLNYYRASFVSEVEEWESYKRESPDELDLFNKTKGVTSKTYTDTRKRELGFTTQSEPPVMWSAAAFMRGRGGEAFQRLLDKECAKRFGHDLPPKVFVLRADVSVQSLSPLIEQGHCSYAIGWLRSAAFEKRVLSGEIDYRVLGLLSREDFEKLLAKLIIDEAVKADTGGSR